MKMDKAPVYVKLDKYKEIADLIAEIRAKVNQARDALDKVEQVKAAEDREMSKWRADLQAVEKKIREVEEVLQ